MSGNNCYIKDPDAKLTYAADWTSWLNGDTIASHLWIVPSGITKLTENVTDTIATIKLGGGTLGEEYEVVSRIVTALGEEEDRTLYFRITDR